MRDRPLQAHLWRDRVGEGTRRDRRVRQAWRQPFYRRCALRRRNPRGSQLVRVAPDEARDRICEVVACGRDSCRPLDEWKEWEVVHRFARPRGGSSVADVPLPVRLVGRVGRLPVPGATGGSTGRVGASQTTRRPSSGASFSKVVKLIPTFPLMNLDRADTSTSVLRASSRMGSPLSRMASRTTSDAGGCLGVRGVTQPPVRSASSTGGPSWSGSPGGSSPRRPAPTSVRGHGGSGSCGGPPSRPGPR